MKNLLELEPIKKFIASIGKDVERFFGKDDACIIYLRPDGAFYGIGLYEWLRRKKKNLTLATMEDDGQGLDEQKVKGRKVLLVDNDIITGKGYKRSTEVIRERKEHLGIKDMKFAVFSDRVGLADFSVGEYSATGVWNLQDLDAVDVKIISFLAKDGRMSFAEIGKKMRLSAVTIKNRVDKLLKEGILKIHGMLSIPQFYNLSAQLQIEAETKAMQKLIEVFEKSPEVYYLVKISGMQRLVAGILLRNLDNIEEFIEGKIRPISGIRNIEVFVGEFPIIPKTFMP